MMSSNRNTRYKIGLLALLSLLVVEMICDIFFQENIITMLKNISRKEQLFINTSWRRVSPEEVVLRNYSAFYHFSKLRTCAPDDRKLEGPIEVLFDKPTIEELEKNALPWVENGGRYRPSHCQARNSIAVVIPFRARDVHLRILLKNLHPLLRKQNLDYTIYVINQEEGGTFNKALLMNVGFIESLNIKNHTCFVFHDVDLIPEDDRNIYGCFGNPRHISVAIDKFNYTFPYGTLFGGVTSMSKAEFELVNGYSNMYVGWGGEDDDMYYRIKHKKMRISRPPYIVARYKMIKHTLDEGNEENKERIKLLEGAMKRIQHDGINSAVYKVTNIEFRKLFTWISVDIPEVEDTTNATLSTTAN